MTDKENMNNIYASPSEKAANREAAQDNPFNPRTEISADAKHIASRIVTHLWILGVALPLFVGLLLWLFGVVK